MSYVDVHCHINSEDYGNVETALEKVFTCGVKKIIVVGFDLASSVYCKDLAEKYPWVYFTAGYHPTELKNYRQGDLYEIEKLCRHQKCVAVGEIGLDYHYPDTDKALQKELFYRQIELAGGLGLPVQIHSRDCAEDTYNALKENLKKLNAGAMLHCYSYSVEMATEFCKMGLYFSFGGTSTYKGSKRAQRSIKALPVSRLLTETDSPYLPPKSKYGTFPNTPESIPEICANMAQLKGMEEQLMSDIVWQNAHRLFSKLNNLP